MVPVPGTRSRFLGASGRVPRTATSFRERHHRPSSAWCSNIASMAIAMIWFLAALLAVLTQLGSVSFLSFPWSGILLFLLAEMSSESNQVRNCIWIVKRTLESDSFHRHT